MNEDDKIKTAKDGYTRKFVNVTLVLENGDNIRGEVNMNVAERFSDFLHANRCDFIKMRDAYMKDMHYKFVIVPTNKILLYVPEDEDKS